MEDERHLLRAMDDNFAAAYREHTRHVEGGEVRRRGSVDVFHVPAGDAMHNAILVHGEVDAAELIAIADARRAEIGARFCIFTREHADRHLEEPLAAAGYRHLFDTPGMVLHPERRRPSPPSPHGFAVRPVESLADVLAYGEIAAHAFHVLGARREAVRSFFTRRESLAGPDVQGYLGCLDGAPVSAAALYVSPGVAGVGWVATLPEHFGKRLAEAVTGAVLDEGFRRGLAIANLQASPMGEKVYRRMGFESPTRYRAHLPLPRS